MKKLLYLLSVTLFVPSFAFVPVLAEGNKTTSSNSGSGDVKTTVATTPTTTPPATTPPPTTPSSSGKSVDDSSQSDGIKPPSTDATEMGKRLTLLKSTLKVNLDDATKKRIVAKCKPAQTTVETTEKSDESAGTKRDGAYKKVTDAIQNLIDRLKANGADTTELTADLAVLNQKVTLFNTDMTTYRQALSDLRLLDCATDPAAFQAALTTARTDREKVRTDALDIRTYITGTLKPALIAVKAKLKTDTTTPTTPSTSTDKTKPTTTGGTQ